MSSPVTTSYTPPTARAAATSMRLMRPCATVLRKILPYSIPGSRRLCTYSARPVTLSHDSSRGTERPTCGVSAACVARFIQCPRQKNLDQVPLVGSGAVQVAFNGEVFREGHRAVGGRAYEDALRVAQHDCDADRRPVVGRAGGELRVCRARALRGRDLGARGARARCERGLQVPPVEAFHGGDTLPGRTDNDRARQARIAAAAGPC